MKIWVIALALAVFAGSQAFVIRSAPEPDAPSKLAQFLDEIEHFWEQIDNISDHRWELMKKTESGKIIAKWLEDDPTEAPAEGQATKEEEGFIESVIDLISDVFDMVEKAFDEIDKKTPEIVIKLKEEVVAAVGHRLDPVVDRLSPLVVPHLKWMLEKNSTYDATMEREFQAQVATVDRYLPAYLRHVEAFFSKL